MFKEAERRGDRETATAIMGMLEERINSTPPSPLDVESQNVADAVLGSQPKKTLSSVREPLANILSGAVAEPIAGLGGLLSLPFVGADQASQNISSIREALTIQPKTLEGQQGLKKFTDFVDPLASKLQSLENTLGDAGDELGGPLLGAIAKSIPTAIIESASFIPVRRLLKRGGKGDKRVARLVNEAAPSADELKNTARGIYDELDGVGAKIKSKGVANLLLKIDSVTNKAGISDSVHPASAGLVKDLFNSIGGDGKFFGARGDVRLIEMDTARKTASDASRSMNPEDARMSGLVLDEIDDFMDGLTDTDFDKSTILEGKDLRGIGAKYRDARQMWNRARKSEILDEIFAGAGLEGSGFEKALRDGFKSLLKSPKRRRGFTAEERAAMKTVVKGTTAANITAALGKLGYSSKQTAYMILSSMAGVGIGSLIASSGGAAVGAITLPLFGDVSRTLAGKLTRNNGKLANTIIKAGPNAKKVVSAYMKQVPASQRSVSELTELLIRPSMILPKGPQKALLKPSPQQKVVADAMFFAAFIQSQKQDDEEFFSDVDIQQ